MLWLLEKQVAKLVAKPVELAAWAAAAGSDTQPEGWRSRRPARSTGSGSDGDDRPNEDDAPPRDKIGDPVAWNYTENPTMLSTTTANNNHEAGPSSAGAEAVEKEEEEEE